jgi:hypothetical protein
MPGANEPVRLAVCGVLGKAHISCTLVHLANASYRLGRELNLDPKTEQVIAQLPP